MLRIGTVFLIREDPRHPCESVSHCEFHVNQLVSLSTKWRA